MKHKILLFDCKPGMILTEDIICNGLKLASKNTILNSYIIDKLISLGNIVLIYMFLKETIAWARAILIKLKNLKRIMT